MKALNKEAQAAISVDQAVEKLIDGNKRFTSNASITRDLLDQVKDTSKGQYPFATVLSCIDSRIPTEVIFDQGIGDIFNARIAGNFVNPDILGSMEFASALAGAHIIVVMGHTSCGAVKGACDHAKLGNLTQMLDKIMPAVDATTTPEGEERNSSNIDFVNRVSEKNVHMTIEQIRQESSVLADLETEGKLKIVGAMYNVETGGVEFY